MIFLTALGNHGMIGNNSLLTDTHKTGANPELANIGGKRFVVFREVPERSRFENSAVKELTGGGTICARTLFEKTTAKNLYLTLVVEVNQKPKFKEEATQADIRRLIDLYYPSTFTDVKEDVDPQNNIFLANTLYKSKDWQQQHKYALMKIVMDEHKFFCAKGGKLTISKSVEKRNRAYLEGSSDILGWFYDVYEKTDNINDILKLQDIFEQIQLSEYYKNLTKQERREYNSKAFYAKISENVFLRKYYHEMKMINGSRYKNILTQHKKIKFNTYDMFLLDDGKTL